MECCISGFLAEETWVQGASTAVNFCKEDIIYLWWNPGWNSFLIMFQTTERAQKRNWRCRENPSKQCRGQDRVQAWKRDNQNQHKLLASPFVDTKPVWVSGAFYDHRNWSQAWINQASPGCWQESLQWCSLVGCGCELCLCYPGWAISA